jgi:uncharacterized delta-60 repeat protein
MFKKLIFLVVLVFIGVPVFAQSVDTAWVARYNGTGNASDNARAIATDDSGYIYVTGESWDGTTALDYVTVKYKPNGDTVWVRRYNGPTNGDDYATAIAVDNSFYIYVSGRSPSSVTNSDYATIKYNSNGDTAWVKRYNGPGNSTDGALDLAVDGLGNVCVTGYSLGSGTSIDYATIKYLPNGDTTWVRRYNGPGNSGDVAVAIGVDDSGNVYVTGYSYSGTSNDYATIKYLPNGDTAWVRRYNGLGNSEDYASALVVDGSGNVYVTGYSYSGTSDDYATIKYLPNGDTAWVRRYNGPENGPDYATAIAVDDSGNIYVTGSSNLGEDLGDCVTIKYYPTGDTAWVRRYDGPGNSSDYARAMAVDGSGNVYVTGYSYDDSTNEDYVTVKYDAHGNEFWVKRYNGPGNNVDEANAIALDGEVVYVTGESDGSGTDIDYATIKYIQFQQINDTLKFTAYSPVDIIVTDPNSDSIGIDFNTIPEATYDTTLDVNEDEDNDDVVIIPKPIIGEYMVKVVAEPGSGGGTYTLAVKLNGNEDRAMVANATCPGPGEVDTVYYPVIEYLRGDANTDGSTSISDVIFLINYLFKGGSAPVPLFIGDANCCKEGEGSCTEVNLSVSDVIYLINYLFKGGTAPCS